VDAGTVLAAGREGDRREHTQPRQRLHFRHPLASLAYVRLDHANGGIIRNISQSGVAIQAVGRLHVGQVVHLRFDLLRPKVRVEATGQVTWANEFGQAGIAFLNLPPRPQRALKEWLMTDLLAAASELAPAKAPIFSPAAFGQGGNGLILGEPPVPSIHVVPSGSAPDESTEEIAQVSESPDLPLRFSWWPADISPRAFAAFVDGLVIASAVLLFAIIAIESTGIIPAFWSAFSLAAFLSVVFAGIYWVLFTSLTGRTLGRKLAQIAANDLAWLRSPEEDTARFR
jgi:PilZ domain/RDD family